MSRRIPKRQLWFPIAILLVLVLTACASQNPIVLGSSVPSSQDIDNDAILTGTNVTVTGNVNGNVLAAGRDITIDGNVSGSLFAVGEDIIINGQVEGGVYAGALNMVLAEAGAIGQNLYFVGVRLETQSGSTVGRDLFAASLTANLGGNVGRDTNAIIGVLEIINLILESLQGNFNVPDLFPSSSLVPALNLTSLPKSSLAFGALSAFGIQEALEAGPALAPEPQDIDQEALQEAVFPRVQEFIILLILGALTIWLLPARLVDWSNQGRRHPYQSTGYGLVGAIMAPVTAGLVAILLLAAGLFIGLLGFWQPALLFILLGYSGLGLGLGIFLLAMLYVSKIIVAFLVGDLVLKRISPASREYKILSLLIGLFIYEVLRLIPYLGWAIGVVVTLLGLGAIWMAYRRKRLLADLEALQAEAQAEGRLEGTESEEEETEESSDTDETEANTAEPTAEETEADEKAEGSPDEEESETEK